MNDAWIPFGSQYYHMLVVNGDSNEPGQTAIYGTLDIGEKTEAVNIISFSRHPILRKDLGWELQIEAEENHHEVYVLL